MAKCLLLILAQVLLLGLLLPSVSAATFVSNVITRTLRIAVSYGGSPKSTQFHSHLPAYTDAGLATLLDGHHVTVTAGATGPDWGSFVSSMVPSLFLIGFWIYRFRRGGSATQGLFADRRHASEPGGGAHR
ncbi:MAG TPA: hypothetical protein VET65_07810 [Candidatus Limnocylindrales bacterium]|nr:hypothetical protein [Candidatus Limnocylindrales bacterium]